MFFPKRGCGYHRIQVLQGKEMDAKLMIVASYSPHKVCDENTIAGSQSNTCINKPQS